MTDVQVLILQRFYVVLMAFLLGSAVSLLAWRMGYYQISLSEKGPKSLLKWYHVFGVFALFLLVELVVTPAVYLAWFYLKNGTFVTKGTLHLDPVQRGWFNLLAIFCVLVAMLFCLKVIGKEKRQLVWGNWKKVGNIFFGIMTWFIAYPWVVVVSQLIGILLQVSYKGPHVDQVAVKYVKETITHPYLLGFTIFSIVAIVPVIEELLFRGFLQTWIKGKWGRGKAIVGSSLIFALFHFSTTQGMENVELLPSLFVLACFLGFIRERQGSLWASIGLHGTFNFISIAMILLTSEK